MDTLEQRVINEVERYLTIDGEYLIPMNVMTWIVNNNLEEYLDNHYKQLDTYILLERKKD